MSTYLGEGVSAEYLEGTVYAYFLEDVAGAAVVVGDVFVVGVDHYPVFHAVLLEHGRVVVLLLVRLLVVRGAGFAVGEGGEELFELLADGGDGGL